MANKLDSKKGWWVKIKNVLKEGITRNRMDFLNYTVTDGIQNNDFPQYLIDLVEGAPMTKAAISRRLAFIVGKGLSDPEIEKLPVNKEYKFGEFHRRISEDYNYIRRFAAIIQLRRNGTIESVKHVPFEWVRWGKEKLDSDDIWFCSVNPYLKTSDDMPTHNKYYPVYGWENTNVKGDIDRITNAFPKQGYIGHIVFYNKTGPRNRIYSRPDYFSAENHIEVDRGIGQFFERNLANNFFLGGMIKKFGDPDQGILNEKGEQYTTVGQEYAKELAAMASGVNGTGTFLIDWFQSDQEKAEFIPWQTSTNHEMIVAIQNQIEKVVFVAVGIPQVLAGVPTAGKLGNVQEMRNAIKWTNETTEDDRQTLEEFYKRILTGMGVAFDDETFGINRVRDITDLPDSVFNAMTPKQKQAFIAEEYNIEMDEEAAEEVETEETVEQTETEDDGSDD